MTYHKLCARYFWTLALCACFWFVPQAAQAQVYISEFLADSQTNTKVDEDGDHSDWVELWNAGSTAVSLNGWYLTDKATSLRKWQFPVTTPVVSLPPNGRMVVFCSDKNRKLEATKLHTSFKISKDANNSLLLVQADGLTIAHQITNYPKQVQDVSYGLPAQTQTLPLVAVGATGKYRVPASSADMPPDWNSVAFVDSAWSSGASGFGYDTAGNYGALIGAGGDLQAAMYNVNATALVRIPFTASNIASITALKLSMKYDDGFVCYLNGTYLFSSQAPGTLEWNSSASADRDGSQTAIYQIFNSSTAQSLLVEGNNVLSFQMLNNSSGSTQDTDNQATPNGSRALCLPFLEATASIPAAAANYLVSATGGYENTAAVTSFGPIISQTTKTVARPSGLSNSAPIVISAKVVASIRPLNGTNPVQLKYRLMQGSEVTVFMKDDGVLPDAVLNDGVFTAQFPTVISSGSTFGQMFRWRIEARDNNATPAVRTDPPYGDPTDNEQYYGTVTLDDAGTSQLPVMHWFIANPSAGRTEAGTRCSLFHLGRFYDNVFCGLHGQSSAGFPVNKKSQDLNFNEDNRFLWKVGEDEQKAVNLITTYADKTRLRDCLAWETWSRSGHIASHWAQTVRVQQNGTFFGIYDLVENGDEDFLKRAGLDDTGALYKCYNSLENVTGVEKKSREWEGTADLEALETGMDPAKTLAVRRQYAYDNVDIPSLVNYLAANAIVTNQDFGHKNYYIYRDSNGTREWSVLPWDQDLTFGHTWTANQTYWDDDIDSQRGLILGAAYGNRVMNILMSSSEMSQMFLRRMRTLMDTMLVSATATDGPLEQRINEMVDAMDPQGATYLTDADLDVQKWGYWVDGSGVSLSAATEDAATFLHGPRVQAQRILSTNIAPMSATNTEGLGNTTFAYLPGRRARLYNGGLTLSGHPIPGTQAMTPSNIVIEKVDANPGSIEQEYFIIRNNSSSYVDISGWKITGAVDYTFRGGTIIPPFTSGSSATATGDVHNGRLHVARSPFGFRNRSVSPKGNEYRLVTGGYSGQLSARGETINLVKPGAAPANDVIVATNTYTPTPTAAQNYLRITELAYHPADPSPAELAALPGVGASDFEFIELANTGPSPINLGGAILGKGVDFTFPAGFILQPGQRCVLVALMSAYQARYGSAGATVAGQFDGHLDNAGESLELIDADGEVVFDFTYDPAWYGVTASNGNISPMKGYSLVTRAAAPMWNAYDSASSWALADTSGGSPGTTDTTFANVYNGWRKDYFTSTEEANTTLSALTADPDGDGRSNLDEFVFGGNPRVMETKPAPGTSFVQASGSSYLAITFARRHHLLDVTVIVETSGDLVTWTPVEIQVGAAVDLGNGMDSVIYRDNVSSTNGGPRFIRVRAVK